MSSICKAHDPLIAPQGTESVEPAQPEVHRPARSLIFLLAAGAGLSVASLYYSQPLLGVLAAEFGAGAREVGFVPTLTQLGYALGILLLAPLGDRHDRRRIILGKSVLLVLALLAAGLAGDFGAFLLASLAIGLTATLAQDFVPAAASLAPEQSRGRIVGTVMTGLLMGILLSRVVSGLVAEFLGWRAMFAAAAVGIGLIGLASWRWLPRFVPTTQLSYRALLASLPTLLGRHRELRRAALSQGLLSVGFSAFWSTLAIMLHGAPFHLGSAVAGAFGLAGAAGALVAPMAGHLADRRGPALVIRLASGLTALSFGLMCLGTQLSPTVQLVLLGIATMGFDLGVQASLIAHQSIVYGLDPGARSRLNAVLVVSMFLGMAAGAVAGSLLFAQWGWLAVSGMAMLMSLAALAVRGLRD